MSDNVDDERSDCSLKVFRMILNYLFKETYDTFICGNGQFRKTFLWLLRSICEEELMTDDRKLDSCRHKIYMIYSVYLFSNYLETSKMEFLLKLRDKLFSKDLTAMPLPDQQLNELRKVFLRKLATVCFEDNGDELKKALKQFWSENSCCIDDIRSDKKYFNYTNEQFYVDICDILKRDDYYKHDSVLIKIAKYFDKCENIDNPERLNDISQAFLEYLDFRKLNGADTTTIEQNFSLNNTPTIENQATADISDQNNNNNETNNNNNNNQINETNGNCIETNQSPNVIDLYDDESSQRKIETNNTEDVKPTTSNDESIIEITDNSSNNNESGNERKKYTLRNNRYLNRYREWSVSSSSDTNDTNSNSVKSKKNTRSKSTCSNSSTHSSCSSSSFDFEKSYTKKKTKAMYFVKSRRTRNRKEKTKTKCLIQDFFKIKKPNEVNNKLTTTTYNLRASPRRIKSEPLD